MATNIDKALYQAPAGVADVEEAEPLEIEIVDPEEVNIGIDGLEISLTKEEPSDEDFSANLAESMDEGAMGEMASTLNSDIDNDRRSRSEWERTYKDGLKLLGLQYEERTEPWTGACGVFHPMITEAVVRFQAETITETFPAAGPVRTKIIGKETPEKKAAAHRVEEDMNYELTERMVEFRPEHERMLWSLPAVGSTFKKVYYDPSLGRQVSVFIPAEDILLPYGTSDIFSCHRVTHVMRKTKNEIVKLQQAGFYRDIELGEPTKTIEDIQKAKDEETGFSDINDERYVIYECHVDLNLKGYEDKDDEGEETGIALPYVVTLLRNTNEVLAIRRNWKEEDPLKLKRQHFVHYQYIPGFGAYGFGLFHLIGGFAKSATSIMRQLVDAGTLANLPGGLKSRGLRIKGDDTPISPGEFRDVDVGSGSIRDNILPLPYKEPSGVLYQLLGNIVEEGRRFAATADLQVSDMSAQAPVGTTLALLERQLKVMTAVQARVHYSLKQELNLLKQILRDYTDENYDYEPDTATVKAKKEDYSVVEVIPVSDPNAATLSQRVVQYQAVIQLAQSSPDIYDMPQLHRGMLEVLGIKNAEKLVPLPEDQKPRDPVSENMAILKGEPVKAFRHQDHQSHIQVHMSMMQDPIVMQMIGQSPRAPMFQAAMMAHVAEHVGYGYQQNIEQQLGVPLPPEDEKLPPQIEMALSSMMAQAAQQVLMKNQAQAAQQQAQQQAQDPVVQMQMQELQIKAQEVALKEKKLAAEAQIRAQEAQLKERQFAAEAQLKAQDSMLKQKQLATDAATKADELALRKEEISGKLQLEAMRIGSDLQHKKATMTADQEREGVRMGIDIAKSKQQAAAQARAAAQKPKETPRK